MNHPAHVFRDLLGSWHRDSADERVDVLAAELAACVAATPGALCLGLLRKDAVPKLFGLLDGYGLLLRQRYRQQGDGVFVFAERKAEVASEFTGQVREMRQPYALPRAA
jgi:hypothetical protein